MLFGLVGSSLLLGLAAVLLLGLMTSSPVLRFAAALLLGLVVRPTLLFRRGASLLLHTLLPSPLIVGSRCLIGSWLDLLPIARSGVVALPA